MTGVYLGALFTGKAAQVAAMLIVTIALLLFGMMALRLRSQLVNTLNETANNVVDKFIVPKDTANSTSSATASGGAGGGGGDGGGANMMSQAANTLSRFGMGGMGMARMD